MPHAEIVDGRLEPKVTIGSQDVKNMPGVELFVLGELEDDAVELESRLLRRFQGHAYAGAWFVYGIWHEIDGQLGRALPIEEPCGKFNRLHAALLIEGIAVAVIDLTQNGTSAFAIPSANQSLVSKYLAIVQVDDR